MSGPRLVKVHGPGGWWMTGSIAEGGGLAVTRCGHWWTQDGRGTRPAGWQVTHLRTGAAIRYPPAFADVCCLPLDVARRLHALLVPLAVWGELTHGDAALARKVADAFLLAAFPREGACPGVKAVQP